MQLGVRGPRGARILPSLAPWLCVFGLTADPPAQRWKHVLSAGDAGPGAWPEAPAGGRAELPLHGASLGRKTRLLQHFFMNQAPCWGSLVTACSALDMARLEARRASPEPRPSPGRTFPPLEALEAGSQGRLPPKSLRRGRDRSYAVRKNSG